MTQKLEIFIIAVISLTFAFLAGVKYADSVKESIGWIFEARESDVELPDLSKESMIDSTAEDQEAIDHQSQTQKKATQPAQATSNKSTAIDSSIKTGEENNDQPNDSEGEVAN